ncbi:DUF4192 domain-containing protein [Nocardioides sp. AX2bis]|uniref:DUF4192 domain-containing protein n=1 Tax=Nocardioides sp. AX2bis TaxID=2653157 RepID=UPI0012F4196C|nr:DUF4192 domain-containing protein [Nocardioides sp. AX2bis]VXB37291.1 conserved hypothetical protein [Nocardioides sp. AX2bis]
MTTARETPSLTVRAPEDLLALAPVVLGFTPTDSVVLLTFGVGSFHARADLPARGDAQGSADLVAMLLDPVRRHGVPRAAVLLFTPDAVLARSVARALEGGLRRAGVDVIDALRAHEGRWWPARGRRPGVPVWGVPYDAAAHPFAAQAVVDGRVTLPSRDALVDTLAPVAGLVDEVGALAAVVAAAAAVREPTWASRERRWAADLVRDHVRDRTVPAPGELARLVVGLGSFAVRDAVWATTPPAQDARAARDAADLWTEVVRRCPRRWRAPAAALLAYAAWNSGNGALAWCAIDVAEEADPTHTLTGLVAHMLTAAVRPGSFDPAVALFEGTGDPLDDDPWDASAG